MAWKYKTNAATQHQKSEDSGNQFKPKLCKKRMYGKPCGECSQVAKLAQSDDEDDKTIVGKCRAKSTYYWNIVEMGSKKNMIMGSGVTNWRDLIANLPDEDGDGVDFTDPDAAHVVLLVRSGKGRNTTYTLTVSPKSTTIPVKFLKGMYPLHKVEDYLKDEDIIFIPKEGKNKFLVLPPWGPEADGDFFKEVFFHWNVSLLGSVDDDGFGEDEVDDGFGDDTAGDETYSDDDFGDDKETKSDDDFGDEAETDDFEDNDDKKEDVPDLDSMTKEDLIAFAEKSSIDLSAKAKAAPLDKLLPYVKKKFEDVPF